MRILVFFTILFLSCSLVWCNENLYNKWKNLCDLLENEDATKIEFAKSEILESLSKLEAEDSIYPNLLSCNKEFQSAVENLNLSKIRETYPLYILEKQKINEKSGQVYGIFVLIFTTFIILGIFLAIMYQITIGKMTREKENYNTILKTQEDERKRISLELHDGVAQKMRYVGMVASRISGDDADEIKTLQTECITEIRSICYNLYSPDIERGDLQSAIQMLAMDFKNRTKTEAKFFAEENIDFSFLTEDQMHDVFRIVQESLSNIEKHAKASEVVIFMRNSKNNNRSGLIVIVTDNGIGLPDTMPLPPPAPTFTRTEKENQFNHFGIPGMMSRAKNFTVKSHSTQFQTKEQKSNFLFQIHREAEDEKFFSC